MTQSNDASALRLHDRRWRLNNLYFITDKAGNKIKFKMNWAQEQLLDEMHFLNIILKARQLGFTTFIVLFMLDACLFNANTHAGIIAHSLVDVEEIFSNKVKFAYDNLPDTLKRLGGVATETDTARKIAFKNDSIIRVGTSMRSGTLQYLLVSEHGKICARYPDKAKEIRTGALNAIEAGQFVFIESTAEGQSGDFHDMTQRAKAKAQSGTKLTPLDFKFHFYPWWRNPKYRLDPADVVVPARLDKYFAKLADEHAIVLDDAQRAWYVKKEEDQQDDMKREFPSFPEEAFAASVEGAYYGKQMTRARLQGRITSVPWEPSLPVYTFWDLGMDDSTTIWFMQRVGLQSRFIDFYKNNGESLGHYAQHLRSKPYTYGEHHLPHDVEVRELGAMDETTGKPRTRKATLEGLEVRPIIVVQRTKDLLEDIEASRRVLEQCWFDEAKCEEGIKALENYRKEWDETLGVFKSYPRHDDASHGASGFHAFAKGFRPADPKRGQVVMADTDFGVM